MAERKQSRGISRRPEILDALGSGGMPDGEAEAFAERVVRELRSLGYHYPEGPAPDPDEVRERREARQHDGG